VQRAAWESGTTVTDWERSRRRRKRRRRKRRKRRRKCNV